MQVYECNVKWDVHEGRNYKYFSVKWFSKLNLAGIKFQSQLHDNNTYKYKATRYYKWTICGPQQNSAWHAHPFTVLCQTTKG
jgi:hypothetical protein